MRSWLSPGEKLPFVAEVAFTPKAQRDLRHIWSYVAKENPAAADRLVDRIFEKCELAARFPSMGPPRPALGPTVRVLFVGTYVVVMRARPNGIEVLAIVHGARDPRSWLS
jgi:toxin ParE1/3/4